MDGWETLENFIALEGLDGSGTTTQLHRYVGACRVAGIDVWETWEPTDGPVGRLIREVLSGRKTVLPETLAFLFAADRYEHVHTPETGIVARLRTGQRVVSDRYLFSSLAYQSVGWDLDHVLELNRRFPLPEHLVFIHVDPELAVARSSGRGRRDIYEHLQFQRLVLERYRAVLDLLDPYDVRIHDIDGSLPQAEVTERICRAVGGPPILKV
jgi:dTMP kinase